MSVCVYGCQDYEEELGKYSSEGMDEVLSRTPSTKPMLCHSCHIIRPVRAKHCKYVHRSHGSSQGHLTDKALFCGWSPHASPCLTSLCGLCRFLMWWQDVSEVRAAVRPSLPFHRQLRRGQQLSASEHSITLDFFRPPLSTQECSH